MYIQEISQLTKDNRNKRSKKQTNPTRTKPPPSSPNPTHKIL